MVGNLPLSSAPTGAQATAFGGIVPGGQRYGLLRVINNSQLDSIQAAQAKMAATENAQAKDEIRALAGHILSAWERNKSYKEESGVEEEMLQALRQRNSEYDPDKLAAIESQGGTQVFMPMTNMKCCAGESWLHDILDSEDDKPWGLSPTPLPDLPPEVRQSIVESTLVQLQQHIQAGGAPVPVEQIAEVAAKMREDMEELLQQEAEDRAGRMETKIHDQQIEGRWEEAFSALITNVVTLKAGFIKGPVVRRRKRLVHLFIGGKTRAVAKEEIIHEYESPSPFDMYPSAGAVNCNQGELIERIRPQACDLEGMKGLPGWDSDAIDAVLLRYRNGGLRNWTSIDQERLELEDKGSNLNAQRDFMEGLEYWGNVQGKMLMEEGITTDLNGGSLNATSEYQVNAILIGEFVVYRGLNPDPLGERPYSKTGWSLVPGSFWYKGVPELMRDLQAIVNATIRALVNNEAVCSGPQVIYNDTARLPIGTDLTQLFPFKIHQFSNSGQSTVPPMTFYQPQSNANELLGVAQAFSNMADEYTGIPSYAHGNDNVRGAGRTASGLSMLMSSAARGMKMVIGRIDREVLKPTLRRQFNWNMAYDPDESIKGDVQIMPRGALSHIIKEQVSQRRMEYLNATNNPVDLQLMGAEFRGQVLKDTAMSLDVPIKKFRTSEEYKEVEAQVKAQQEAEAQLPQTRAA